MINRSILDSKYLITFAALLIFSNACQADGNYLTDPHTSKPVTINACPTTVEQLLQSISPSGCPLTCKSDLKSQELHVVLHNRPLHDVMGALAHLLDGNWLYNSKTRGYLFYVRRRSVQYAKTWWDLLMSERSNDALENYRNTLHVLNHPVVDVSSSSFTTGENNADLTPEELEQIKIQAYMQKNQTKFMTDLPDTIKLKVAHCDYGFDLYSMANVDVSTSYYIGRGELVIPFSAFSGYDKRYLRIVLNNFKGKYQPPASEEPEFVFYHTQDSLSVEYLLTNGDRIPVCMNYSVPDSAFTLLNQKYLPRDIKIFQAHGTPFSDNMLALAKYARSTVWPSNPQRTPADTEPTNSDTVQPVEDSIAPDRADLLQRIAQQGNADIVADYDWQRCRPLTESELTAPLEKPVIDELNICSQKTDSSWYKCHSGIIVDRDNRWYRDDKLNVPHSLLRKFYGQLQIIETLNGDKRREAELKLDSSVWSVLSGYQLVNGFQWAAMHPAVGERAVLVFRGIYAQIRQSWPAVDFCSSLSSNEISKLVHGGIALNDLSQSQLDMLQKDYPALVYFRGSRLSAMKVTVATRMGTVLTSQSGFGIVRPQGEAYNQLQLDVVPQ